MAVEQPTEIRTTNMKKDYEDDPEEYWREKQDRKDSNGQEIIDRWERENPHVPYGYSLPSYLKD